MSSLLAIDLGLRTGLALYERPMQDEGVSLQWYRSRNFGTAARLRLAARGILGSTPGLEYIVIEGGGPLADIWGKEAKRKGVNVVITGAEVWRELLLYPREQRTGAGAKSNAIELARKVIELSEAPRPTSLRHDAAEAVLIGLWGMIEVGWLGGLPERIR